MMQIASFDECWWEDFNRFMDKSTAERLQFLQILLKTYMLLVLRKRSCYALL